MKAFDCWDGYDQKVVTIEINGCLYDVEVCYKCAATSMESAVQIVSIEEVDPNCDPWPLLTYAEVWDAAVDIIYDWEFLTTEICDQMDPAPCPDGLHYAIYSYKCMLLGNDNGNIYMTSCYTLGDNYCIEGYIYCWDPEQNKMVRMLVYGPEESTRYECPPNPEPAPGNPDFPDQPGEISPCFTIASPCDE